MTARMLAPRAGATVVDCAAAPGGKATHLAEIVGEHGRVIAVDVNLNGLKNARALARRLRHRNVEFVCADLTAAAPLRESNFDYVLLDAPCTGIGTLREHPEIKWRLKPSDPARMAAMQSRCSNMPQRWCGAAARSCIPFAALRPKKAKASSMDFLRSITISKSIAAVQAGELKDVIDARGFMKTRPDVGGLDGFFAARLIRK